MTKITHQIWLDVMGSYGPPITIKATRSYDNIFFKVSWGKMHSQTGLHAFLKWRTVEAAGGDLYTLTVDLSKSGKIVGFQMTVGQLIELDVMFKQEVVHPSNSENFEFSILKNNSRVCGEYPYCFSFRNFAGFVKSE